MSLQHGCFPLCIYSSSWKYIFHIVIITSHASYFSIFFSACISHIRTEESGNPGLGGSPWVPLTFSPLMRLLKKLDKWHWLLEGALAPSTGPWAPQRQRRHQAEEGKLCMHCYIQCWWRDGEGITKHRKICIKIWDKRIYSWYRAKGKWVYAWLSKLLRHWKKRKRGIE